MGVNRSFAYLLYFSLAALVFFVPALRAEEVFIAFGDSVTAGDADVNGSTGAYAERLIALLNNSGRPANVLNYGWPGERSSVGVDRLSTVIAANPTANYVLILHGYNDVCQGASLESTMFNIGAMIDKSVAAGLKPVLSTMTPGVPVQECNDLIPSNYNPSLVALANSKGIPIADAYSLVADNWDSYTWDGTHLNADGMVQLAQAWFNTIRTLPVIGAAATTTTTTTTTTDTGGGGGGGGCFIATAAFGSPAERHVLLLRQFRDQVLLASDAGRAFVRFYYTSSPPIAAWMESHPLTKPVVRALLYPVIGTGWLWLHAGGVALSVMLLGAGLVPCALSCCRKRRPGGE